MINSSDTIQFSALGFDNDSYMRLQKNAILERCQKFSKGRLYFEVGGKLLFDPHAARVLPGFKPTAKKDILKDLIQQSDIIFCCDAKSLNENRKLKSTTESYASVVLNLIDSIEKELGKKPFVVINRSTQFTSETEQHFEENLQRKGYKVYRRYVIEGYPENTDLILSDNGFGKDDYIPVTKNLVIVTGAASNSGKLSTCLGQIYLESKQGIESGYAKYETFPIWNLPITHPVNLAYEAATADIGDYNAPDLLHKTAYGIDSVNYNRDIEAFSVVKNLADKMLPETNFMRSYKSPTDMGINMAGFAITNDSIVAKASIDEISRRKVWYTELATKDTNLQKAVRICDQLEKLALLYLK